MFLQKFVPGTLPSFLPSLSPPCDMTLAVAEALNLNKPNQTGGGGGTYGTGKC